MKKFNMIIWYSWRSFALWSYHNMKEIIIIFNDSMLHFSCLRNIHFPNYFLNSKWNSEKRALNHIQGVHNFDSGPPKLDSLTPTFVIKDLTIAWGSSYLNIFCLIGKDLLDPQHEEFHIKTFLPLGKIKMEIFHLIHDKHICP